MITTLCGFHGSGSGRGGPIVYIPGMIFDLDLERVTSRPGIKWGRHGSEVLAAWVADMDVEIPEVVLSAVRDRIDSGGLGYDFYDEPIPVFHAFADRMRTAFDWDVDPDDVLRLHDVIQGLQWSLETLTEPGDGIVVQTPIYPPFITSVEDMGRRIVPNPLQRTEAGWQMDFDHLEEVAASGDVSTLLLCLPHNPCGVVLSSDELRRLAELADEHDLLVISDEIHADLVYAPGRHVPAASVSEAAAQRTVTVTAATKSFNMAGLRLAFVHTASERYGPPLKAIPKRLLGGINVLGQVATVAGWQHGQAWLDELVAGLDHNRMVLAELLARRLPEVGYLPPASTYLAWLDCTRLGLGDDPAAHFLDVGKVAVNSGLAFGLGGEGHVRLNFATSPEVLEMVVDRMADSLS